MSKAKKSKKPGEPLMGDRRPGADRAKPKARHGKDWFGAHTDRELTR